MSAIPSAAAARTSPRQAPRLLNPAVLEPTRVQWARFPDSDRTLLAGVLHQRIDYVDSPLFRQRNAAKRLFGEDLTAFSTATQVMPVERNANGTLPSSQQTLLFQRLNFARQQQLAILWRFRRTRLPIAVLRILLTWARAEMVICNVLTEANLPLVLAMLKRMRLPSNVDSSELISEGNLALLRCVKKFDCSRGFQFSTYACGAIIKSFYRTNKRMTKYRSRFPTEFDPALARDDSADRHHHEEECLYLEDLGKLLRENRAELNAQEWFVIRARFMLGTPAPDREHHTLEQIGKLVGVTKERVRQIQLKALRKLRIALQMSSDRRDPRASAVADRNRARPEGRNGKSRRPGAQAREAGWCDRQM